MVKVLGEENGSLSSKQLRFGIVGLDWCSFAKMYWSNQWDRRDRWFELIDWELRLDVGITVRVRDGILTIQVILITSWGIVRSKTRRRKPVFRIIKGVRADSFWWTPWR
jgi:hypothetical protein